MQNNILITGAPRVGKTSLLEEIVKLLRGEGFKIGGIYTPEIREGGKRLGFSIVDLMTGENRLMAHVGQPDGPVVSKYRVNVQNVDELSEKAITQAVGKADLIVIDEIGPMEVYSKGFKQAVKEAFDSTKPVVAVIHQRTQTGFIGGVKVRKDIKIFELTQFTRENLKMEIIKTLKESCRD